jgi:hypothetical protein
VRISDDWYDANQQALVESLEPLRRALEEHAGPGESRRWFERGERRARPTSPPAPGSVAERLEVTFGLSPFERDVLLLCAGVELDARFAALCAEAHGDPGRPFATFGLALAALPGSHWSALAPDRPLRAHRLVDVGAGGGVTTAPLRIDERVLHHLAGVDHLDERLVGLVTVVDPDVPTTAGQEALAARLERLWRADPHAAIHLAGNDPAGKRAVVNALCAALGLDPWAVPAALLPASPDDLTTFVRLWEREALLSRRALLVDATDEDGDAARHAVVDRLVDALRAPVVVATREPRARTLRPSVVEVVDKPTAAEQAELWQHALGPAAEGAGETIERLVTQFRLSAPQVTGSVAAAHAATEGDLAERLWDATRAQARPRLDGTAQRVLPVATWDDLVVPTEIGETLRDAVAQVRQRLRVYESWGFAEQGTRGLGISALFSGPSGTGKTLAAEVVARELGLDLYRVDLSQVVSKYIGETEKNLGRVFDAAEESGAVLLFDEADALFGKRSEVKDSHDRYANIEVGYLLQRMEAYRGLAVLTTNMKSALDTAFLRRLRFALAFPFPDEGLRKEIWQRVFPPRVPLDPDIAWDALARLNVAGGNIRNIALHAAFLAAERGGPVTMELLLRGARAEYAKLDKPLTGAEVAGWA